MQVRLIAVTKPLVDVIESPEQLIEYASRKCTATTEKTGNNTANFIQARIRQGHTSILEHVNFTFEINGISRACLAQLTRHRIASYSVESMRYVKYGQVNFTYPDKLKSIYRIVYKLQFAAYKFLLWSGVKSEDARFVLPLAIHTNLVSTMNLRELLHFFSLRLDKAAQWEIRELATAMQKLTQEQCPNVFF